MSAMTEAAQVGKFREIEDALFNVDPAETPFISSIKNAGKKLAQPLAEWVAEKYSVTIPTAKVDGAAVTVFNRQDRKVLSGYMHYFDEPYKVTTLAAEIATAGVRDELGKQRADALKRLRRQMEIQALSTSDTASDTGSTGYTMRGAFEWLKAAAQTTLPVDSTIRPASANNYAGAFASITETTFVAQLTSMFGEKNAPVSLDLHAGIDLKALIDLFTIVYPTASTSAQPRVQYVQQGVGTYAQGVDMISVSAGKVRVMLSPFVNWDVSTGAAGTYSSKSGLLLDPRMWDLAFLFKPRHEALAIDGSGQAGHFEAAGLTRCKNPQGQGYILPTS